MENALRGVSEWTCRKTKTFQWPAGNNSCSARLHAKYLPGDVVCSGCCLPQRRKFPLRRSGGWTNCFASCVASRDFSHIFCWRFVQVGCLCGHGLQIAMLGLSDFVAGRFSDRPPAVKRRDSSLFLNIL